jgi:hypothetical protein
LVIGHLSLVFGGYCPWRLENGVDNDQSVENEKQSEIAILKSQILIIKFTPLTLISAP